MRWTHVERAFKLTSFDIHYMPRKAIKAQALADFMVEYVPRATGWQPDSTWKIYVDRSSSSQGSGASIVLKSP